MKGKELQTFIAAIMMLSLTQLLMACEVTVTPTGVSQTGSVRVAYDFRNEAQGWEAGFADYPSQEEAMFGVEASFRGLPAGLKPSGTGYYIAGSNHSDDL